MIKLGKGTKLTGVVIIGEGDVIIGDDVKFGRDIIINVKEKFELGDRSEIGDFFNISGRSIKIGREFWSGRFCAIGGGSSFEKTSSLEIGDFGHLGDFGFINTARPVKIGNEVGLGQETKIYTHGAYLSWFEGFPVEFGPVTIEDRVWCPKAIIMPNVVIGHDTVVGAGAVVTKSLPAGCLAVGIPVKVIKENCYPKQYSKDELTSLLGNFIEHFKIDIVANRMLFHKIKQIGNRAYVEGTLFDFGSMKIDGKVTELTEMFKNELRRYGIRFRYYNRDDAYFEWE
jgi:acetyltransferase-like isoleucine patch superfamily enzyme